MTKLHHQIRQCTICLPFLEHGVNPVFSASSNSRIVIIGQAPGRKVHESGIPWDDKSGERLRDWLGVTQEQFYDPDQIALVPMGFCYPGKGKSGDLPPRPECAPTWHQPLLEGMTNVGLTILIGSYAQNYYLGEKKKDTLTETVRNFRAYLPDQIVLPHPSPRNNIWLKKNEWFEDDLLPILKDKVKQLL